jgi:hypothetical protein
MSAMPSIHVAIAVWMWLTARSLSPAAAPAALAYAVFIWIASVQLGWHYASDGLAGAFGMVAVWWIAQKLTSGAPLGALDVFARTDPRPGKS